MRRRFAAYSFLSLAIIAGLATFTHTTYRSEHQDTQSYIVQAQSLEQATALVMEAGGEITHELRIINAVGARLTTTQVTALRSMEGVRRVYEDRGVTVSDTEPSMNDTDVVPGCELTASDNLVFSSDGISWQITNTSDIDIHLKKAMLFWPASNYRLRELEVGDSEIHDGAIYGVNATFASEEADYDRDDDDGDDDDGDDDGGDDYDGGDGLRIASGATRDVAMAFDGLLKDQNAYEIRMFFREGCSIEYPRPPTIKFSGDSDTAAKRTFVSSLVGADPLHWEDITGDGVGVAVIDTGIWANSGKSSYLARDSFGIDRIIAHYDAINDTTSESVSKSDKNGHGSHITSLLLSSRHKDSEFNGIAPDADLIVVEAFDDEGTGTYANVIRALDWVLTYKDKLGIRVVNLSFSTEPRSYYWDDPLNQAVMAVWQSGIVVVASAGNSGPDAMSIGVPGNVPYVITVGAMTDNVTPNNWADDTLASFSAAGPTFEAFLKPEIVAPGGHLRGLMEKGNKIATKRPQFHDGDSYYTMSGTSQAAAITSGVAALLLQAEPWLTPDQVKCKLMSTARPAIDGEGRLVYSVFQQGAGLVDADAAVRGSRYDCANRGLDIYADLAGMEHFHGRAMQDSAGNYYIRDTEGLKWDGSYFFGDGYVWGGYTLLNDGMPWNDGILVNDGMPWNDGVILNDGMPWNDGVIVNDGLDLPVSINTWIPQE